MRKSVYIPEDTSNQLYSMELPSEQDIQNNPYIQSETVAVGPASFADDR